MVLPEDLIDRLRGAEKFGTEELLLLMATMGQGQQLDMTSLLTGMLFARAGHFGGRGGLDAAALAAVIAMTSSSTTAQQQAAASGGVAPAPQAFNPLLLLAIMGLGRGEEPVKLEVVKEAQKAR